ncbi:DUF6466 family protein [Bifidobacterium callitrichidarum]|uniref:DUF6466 family protein n=1 Tax=Bifidobacterium callitrichidarum TaxID=2052941 RepID=UPI001473E6CE|nr:DUF6466 family protein [Bifidobacterium callitrichidarum]
MSKNAETTQVRSSARPVRSARGPLAVRIVLAVVAVALLVTAGLAGVNLVAANRFNQATASLTANIKAAQDEKTDADTLHAQQQQTDAQFAEAGRMRAVLLPEIRDAIDANASISAELTKITLERVQEQQGGTSAQSQSSKQNSSSSSNAKKQGSLTEEQRKKVEELMKANQQSADGDSTTTNKTEQKTQNKGTGVTKPW